MIKKAKKTEGTIITRDQLKFLEALLDDQDACEGFKQQVLSFTTREAMSRFIKSNAYTIARHWDVEVVEDMDENPVYNTAAEYITGEGLDEKSLAPVLMAALRMVNMKAYNSFFGSMNDLWKLEKILEHWEDFDGDDFDTFMNVKNKLFLIA